MQGKIESNTSLTKGKRRYLSSSPNTISKPTLQRFPFTMLHWLYRAVLSIPSHWQQLHLSQQMYLVSFIIFAFLLDDDSADSDTFTLWVGLIAAVGFSRELWQTFLKVWESHLGKSVILLCYAVIANFTLALAAKKVNQVVGIEPTTLIYTQGFTTFLLLPFWLLTFSMIAMTIALLFMQIWLLFLGGLKLIGLYRKRITLDEHFPKLFFILRIILLPLVLGFLLNALIWYGRQLSFDIKLFDANLASLAMQQLEIVEHENEVDVELRIGSANRNTDTYHVPIEPEDTPKEQLQQVLENDTEYTEALINRAVAYFVYAFDTFPYSHCEKKPIEHIISIDDDNILLVKPSETAPTGYSFDVKPCVMAER